MPIPGGTLAARPLHFFWLADCSYSMQGDKIEQLNRAIRESIPHMQTVAKDNPNAQVLVRAVKFSSSAEWHVPQPTPVNDFKWSDLTVEGSTSMGSAFSLLADQLKMPPMDSRALPPVIVLISDGMPTDDYKTGLNKLMAEPWGKKAVRISIAIGSDHDFDILKKFIGNPEIPPLQVNNAPDLVRAIRWASTSVLKAASAPMSTVDKDQPVVPPPPPPPPPGSKTADDDDVW